MYLKAVICGLRRRYNHRTYCNIMMIVIEFYDKYQFYDSNATICEYFIRGNCRNTDEELSLIAEYNRELMLPRWDMSSHGEWCCVSKTSLMKDKLYVKMDCENIADIFNILKKKIFGSHWIMSGEYVQVFIICPRIATLVPRKYSHISYYKKKSFIIIRLWYETPIGFIYDYSFAQKRNMSACIRKYYK